MSHYSLAAERGEHGLVKINTTFLHVNLQPKVWNENVVDGVMRKSHL